MMARPIFPWMGLVVLFLTFCVSPDTLAQDRYRVKPGDTLTSIARKFNVDVASLRRNNNLTHDTIKPNQILRITPRDSRATQSINQRTSEQTAGQGRTFSYVVKPGDTLWLISRQTGVPISEIRKLNRITGNNLRAGRKLSLPRTSDQPEARTPEVNQGLLEEEGDGEYLLEEGWATIERDKRETSELLGKWTHPAEQQLLVRVAMGFLGAPYRFGGNSIRGIDCSAFVKIIYNIFGIELPRTAREQSYIGMLVLREELQEGDLVFFNTRRPLGHVGIYVGNNEFVHASYRKKAVRIDSLNAPYFNKRFVRAVRLKGLEENI